VKTVSIIIVNFNGEKHLKSCLSSICEVDYPPEKLEVIVFDNGSSDNSVQVIQKVYPAAVVLKSSKNIGFARPHRLAAQAAKGEILAFLNNDMKVDSQWIRRGVDLLALDKGIACSSSKIMNWRGTDVEFNGGSLQYLGYADQLKRSAAKSGEEVLFPCGGAMFIWKDVFEEAGCFDDDYFAIFEDVDLGWRLWIMGYRVVMAPDSIVYHRGHGTLRTRRQAKMRFLMHRNALMTIIKNYDNEHLMKVLPVAFILAVRRALLFMNIDKKAFYFWDDQDLHVSTPPNFEEACLHLAAIDDVFETFQSLKKKRKAVQGRRKRNDRDIFALFKDPFRNIMGSAEYLWEEVSLFGHFGLERVFQCEEQYKERLDEGIFHAQRILETLQKEIPELPGIPSGMKNILDRKHPAKRFSKSLREEGFRETFRKVARHLVAYIGG
jgi:GT2 family glycosyltransferase